MTTRSVTVVLAVAALALPAGGEATAQGRQAPIDFQWKGRIARGKAIEIRGVNGDVNAAPASGDEVEVTAIKRARRSDPDEVDIQVVQHDDGVTICAVYPAPRRKGPNECVPERDWSSHTDDNDVNVDFTVRVPAGVRLVARTVNGDVLVRSLKSDTELSTVNGQIDVATTGYADATTVNGSIEVAMGGSGWPRHLNFSTVNGGITVEMPDNVGADVEASTVNGEISTDFPLTVSGRFGPRRVHGTIGAGGPLLSMSTVNGSIRLRKAF